MNNGSARTMLLLGFVVVGIAGLGGWQMVYVPYNEQQENIKRLREDVDKKTAERDKIVLTLKLEEKVMRQRSLPADESLAMSDYSKLLQNLVNGSKLQVKSFTPLQKDTRKAPQLAGKKPAYTILSYNIQVRADLYSLVEFMYGFYRQPLLQQIRKITIQVPQTSNTRGARNEELDVTMLIEAIIIDKAENRPTLIAIPTSMGLVSGGAGTTAWVKYPAKNHGYGSPFNAARLLARGERAESLTSDKGHDPKRIPSMSSDYLRIAGKNIFIGPAPFVPPAEPAKPERDYLPFVKLNQISTDSDGYAKASLRNQLLKYDYVITQHPTGATDVNIYYYINKTQGETTYTIRKPLDSNTKGMLSFGDPKSGNYREFLILRLVDTSDVLLQRPEDNLIQKKLNTAGAMVLGGSVPFLCPGKVYRWHKGQSLAEAMEGIYVTTTNDDGEEIKKLQKAEPLPWKAAQAAYITDGGFPESLLLDSKRRQPR